MMRLHSQLSTENEPQSHHSSYAPLFLCSILEDSRKFPSLCLSWKVLENSPMFFNVMLSTPPLTIKVGKNWRLEGKQQDKANRFFTTLILEVIFLNNIYPQWQQY
jgi:hypothetical protein